MELLLKNIPDEALPKLRRGGHSYRKLYAAYKRAVEYTDGPVAILCKTVKGWTLGEGFEASNVTHQMKSWIWNTFVNSEIPLSFQFQTTGLKKHPTFTQENKAKRSSISKSDEALSVAHCQRAGLLKHL